MCTTSLLTYFPSGKTHCIKDLRVINNTSESLKKQSSKKSFMLRHTVSLRHKTKPSFKVCVCLLLMEINSLLFIYLAKQTHNLERASQSLHCHCFYICDFKKFSNKQLNTRTLASIFLKRISSF